MAWIRRPECSWREIGALLIWEAHQPAWFESMPLQIALAVVQDVLPKQSRAHVAILHGVQAPVQRMSPQEA